MISATETADGVHLQLERGPASELRADAVVACAGLHADRVARACGLDPSARIVPFRGEYYELSATAAELVNGLVYPVPDPRFPFLGVHLTRMIGGGDPRRAERGAGPGARGLHVARRRTCATPPTR